MGEPGGRGGLWAVLGRPAYRRLWTAQTVSRWDDGFDTVALAVLVYRLTGSGLGVTGVVAAQIVPVLVLAPVAGSLIDRFPAVKVMIAASAAVLLRIRAVAPVSAEQRRTGAPGGGGRSRGCS